MISYLLQVDPRSMWKDTSNSSNEAVILLAVIGAIVLLIIILNAVKGKGQASSGGSFSGLFTGLTVSRIATSIGLTHEQKKMLSFVFKTDDVADPLRSINNSALLDGHFRRAYKAIEQKSNTEEEAQRKLALLFSTRNAIEHRVSGDLTSTRQLKEDTVLTITAGKEKYTVSVINSKSDHLAIESPKNALGSLIKFEKGDRLHVLFTTKNNKVFSFETHIIGHSKTFGQNTILIAHSKKLKFHSQRRFRRRQLYVQCALNIVYVEGTGKKQKLVVDKRQIAGNMADISVGGCSLKSKAPINAGTKLKIEFMLGENNVAALGQVLRINRMGIVTITHVKFLKVARKSMNLINAFVYEFTNE